MGCCFSEAAEDYDQPDIDTRRRQQAAAAEQRMKQHDERGVKDPEALKRKQRQREEAERNAAVAAQADKGGLKWHVS